MIFKAYFYTLFTALLSTALAVVVGSVASYFTAQRKFWGRNLLLSTSAIPLCVPPLVVALGYVSFFGVNGSLNHFFHSNKAFLYTTAGVIIAQGFYNFPYVLGILNDAIENLPKEQSDAARLLGAGKIRVFFTITLRQLSGSIGAACLPVFLFCFFSFMIILLFSPAGKSTLEVELYHSIRNTLDISAGIKIALLETFTALGIVFMYALIIKKNQAPSGITFVKEKKSLGRSDAFTFVPVILLILLFFICPLFCIFTSGFKSFALLVKIKSFWNAFFTSIWIGLLTGFFCTLLGFLYSINVRLFKKQQNVLLQTIPFISMAISSVLISWIASVTFRSNNPLVLVLLQVILYWPLAFRQIQSGINQISLETQMAAAMLSKNIFNSVFRVYIPSVKKYLLSSFGFCFAVSLGDATMPLILSIKNFNTLALYTYRLAGSYKFSAACACGAIIAVLSALIFRGVKK